MSQGQLWFRTLLFSISLLVTFSIYEYIVVRTVNLYVLSRAIADVAFVLIGLSLGLASFCYFFHGVCSKVLYRRYLGLLGYACILLSGIISLLFLPEYSPFRPYPSFNSPLLPFLITVPALLIYTAMTIVSNNYATRLLGGKRWRSVLHLGFVAYYFSILHFTLSFAPEWLLWMEKPVALPPASLILVIFGLTIVTLRIIMWVSLLNNSQKKSILSK